MHTLSVGVLECGMVSSHATFALQSVCVCVRLLDVLLQWADMKGKFGLGIPNRRGLCAFAHHRFSAISLAVSGCCAEGAN